MKIRLHTILALTLSMIAFCSQAQVRLQKANNIARSAYATGTVTFQTTLAAYYSNGTDYNNYYLIIAENYDASFDSSGNVTGAENSHVASLDFYVPSTEPVLPAGTYKASTDASAGDYYYDVEYTLVNHYNANSQPDASYDITSDVVVEKEEGDNLYTITFKDAQGTDYYYKGYLVFQDINGTTGTYPPIESNVNTTFTGGMGIYNGNLYESQTGNMVINLFDTDFDPESGTMLADGYYISICAFNILFSDPSKAEVRPGTYTVSRKFTRDTYYPGLEIDYIGTTIPFGTYVCQRVTTNGEPVYRYAYINSGTIEITQDDNGYNFNINCTTSSGLTVKGTATGITIPVTDASDDNRGAVISTLEEDHVLDLDYIKTSRIYFMGEQNGCNSFWYDIGSVSGLDGTEGDIMRFEILTAPNTGNVPLGTYEVMAYDHNYTNFYEPWKLVQGYWYNSGELTGTRYMHFEEGRTNVMDELAPAVSGTVKIESVDGTTTVLDGEHQYKVTVNVYDDGGFNISGEWTGPVELKYDPVSAGVGSVATEAAPYLSGETIYIPGNTSAKADLYTVGGQLAKSITGASEINVADLQAGLYILKVEGKEPIKIVKK